MNEKQGRSWDMETDIDEERLSQVPFGRNRFLKALGLGLFGLVAGLTSSQGIADARSTQCSSSPCGLAECSNCRGNKGGVPHSPGTCSTGGTSGGNCWHETTPSNCRA